MRFINIIPNPKEMSIQRETITLNSDWGIDDRSGQLNICQRCAEELNLSSNKQKSNVTLLRDDGLKSEEYRWKRTSRLVALGVAVEAGYTVPI